jgi:hypothetical protein
LTNGLSVSEPQECVPSLRLVNGWAWTTPSAAAGATADVGRDIGTSAERQCYDDVVAQRLSLDTSPEVEARQVEAWRRMSPAEKLRLVVSMSETVRQLALAGIRERHPGASPREEFLRLALLMLGSELARRVYPEIHDLDRS